MADKVIIRAADLMREQAEAYRRLTSICDRMAAALVRGDIDQVESLTRAGEAELLTLRSRLAQITSLLSSFATTRASSFERPLVSADARSAFESASGDLMGTAREFQRMRGRAAALAINGIIFSGACIEMCGVQPTTYNAPYVRRGDGRPWV